MTRASSMLAVMGGVGVEKQRETKSRSRSEFSVTLASSQSIVSDSLITVQFFQSGHGTPNYCLPDFNIYIINVVFKKNLLALEDSLDAIMAGERIRFDTYPDDDRCSSVAELVIVPDADNVNASPSHVH